LPLGQAAPSPSLDPIEVMSVMEEISENRKEQGRQTEKEKSGNGKKVQFDEPELSRRERRRKLESTFIIHKCELRK